MPYTGPGDVAAVDTGGFFYGLRAYNAAYAAPGTNLAIQVTRDGGSTNQNLVILTSGYIDVATAISYAAGNALNIMTWYDQSGNGHDLAQSTDANRPQLIVPVNNFPYVSFSGSPASLGSGNITVGGNTHSVSSLLNSTSTTADSALLAQSGLGTGRQYYTANHGSTGTGVYYDGTALTYTLTNNAWHSATISVDGSNNGTVYVDGASTGPGAVGTNSGAAVLVAGSYDSSSFFFVGYVAEFTYWDTTALSSGQVATINAQQTTYQAAFGSSGVPLWLYTA